MTFGALVALVAGLLLTGVGGSTPPTSAHARSGALPSTPLPADCRLHARVTVDRSAAVIATLRICLRP